MSHLEKSSTQRETEEARPAPQARATLQSYKNSGDTKDARAAKEKGLFQLAQEETWKKMTYFDEDVGGIEPIFSLGLIFHRTMNHTIPIMRSSLLVTPHRLLDWNLP